jgi:hypothetical protein
MSGDRTLRKIFGPNREEVTGEWRKCLTKSLLIFKPHQILLGLHQNEEDEMGGACNTHGRHEKCIQNTGRET